MPKEGKNDRFARRLCEGLLPHFGADYEYIGAPVHGLRQKTSWGHESVGVHLWGAHAPDLHLAFTIGVWHDAFEETCVRLGKPPTIKGALHFWQNTNNILDGWPELADCEVEWDANLNEDPAPMIPELVPHLLQTAEKVFASCSDLRGVRDIMENGPMGALFTMNPWQDIVLIDATMADWKHLEKFLARKDIPRFWTRDSNLIKKVEQKFGVNFPS